MKGAKILRNSLKKVNKKTKKTINDFFKNKPNHKGNCREQENKIKVNYSATVVFTKKKNFKNFHEFPLKVIDNLVEPFGQL